VVLTGDYLADPAFTHADDTDRVVRDIGIRSMVVAPVVAGDEVYGALGTFSSRPDAFSPAQIGLVRALADHAAAAMSNVRLIEALDGSRGELAKRADIERTLREIGARISAASDLPAVLQLSVDEAARLMAADGARIDLIDPVSGLLHGAYASGSLEPQQPLPADPDETIDQGVAGQAVVTGGCPGTSRHPPVIDRLSRLGIRVCRAVDDESRSALSSRAGGPTRGERREPHDDRHRPRSRSARRAHRRLIDRARPRAGRAEQDAVGPDQVRSREISDVVKQAGRVRGPSSDLLTPRPATHWALATAVRRRSGRGTGEPGISVGVAPGVAGSRRSPTTTCPSFTSPSRRFTRGSLPIAARSWRVQPAGSSIFQAAPRSPTPTALSSACRQPPSHHQRPAHRGCAFARRARPDGRCRADVTRDRRPGQRDARPGRDPPGGH
jgi:hypothetical protein